MKNDTILAIAGGKKFAWSSIASTGNIVDAVDEVTEDTWKNNGNPQ